jgi:hypothetical protein
MKENILTLFGSDAVMPEQFAETFRSKQVQPEKALLLAVLEDAIECFLTYHSANDRAGKEQFQEAEEWIMQTGDDWLFSFENVCELLGFDPEYLRQGLRSAKLASQQKTHRQHRLHGQAA